jgi:multiple sugar transport system substrate-binding protein
MSEPKKVGRRTFLNYAIAVVATGVIVGAATYFAVPKGVTTVTAPGTTVTTTKTVTTTVTGTPTTTPPTTSPTTSAPKKGSLTLIFHWSEPDLLKYVDQWISLYTKLNPDVKIDYIATGFADLLPKIMSLRAAGTLPDVIFYYCLWVPDFVEQGILAEAPSEVVDDVKKNYYSSAVAAVSYKDALYGYPTEFDPYGLVYNKEIFDKSGIAVPKTWSELQDAAKKLTIWKDNALEQSGYGFPMQYASGIYHAFVSNFLSNGGEQLVDLAAKRALFNGSEGVEALQLWYDLIYKDKVWSKELPAEDGIPLGKMAMTVHAAWWKFTLVGQMGEDKFKNTIRVALPPYSKRPVTIAYHWGVGVTKTSKNPELAWDFVKFINTPLEHTGVSYIGSFFKDFGIIPSRKSDVLKQAYYESEPWNKGMKDLLEYAKVEPEFVGANAVKDAIYEQLEAVLTTGKSPKQALDDAAKNVEEILRKT